MPSNSIQKILPPRVSCASRTFAIRSAGVCQFVSGVAVCLVLTASAFAQQSGTVLPPQSSGLPSQSSGVFGDGFGGELLRDVPPSVPPVQEGSQSSEQRTARKIATPSLERTDGTRGITYVKLDPSLDRIFAGREPASLSELRALEKQQSLVAKSIETVTVNVQQGAAQGSGVIITGDGYVLTAAHVAGGKDREAWVVLNDGTRVRARTLGMNRDKDAGLLKIVESRSEPWPHATLGRSSDLNVGQWVVAAGHPGGWRPERGAVIRVGRVLSMRGGPVRRGDTSNSAHTLFTDCALIGGDSGGPLFTLEGKLVGIHSRIGTKVEDNMHVPVDVFGESWDRMVAKEVWGVLPGYQPAIGVSGTQGDDRPLISDVLRGGPAHRAGLQSGDLILEFDGIKITTFAELKMGVDAKMPGDVVVLTIERGEEKLRLPVTIGISEG